MSAKRPSRRYIGFRYEPASAPRKAVGHAVERLGAGASGKATADSVPRLLVCQAGLAILVVPTPAARGVRSAMEAAPPEGEALKLTPVVTSGTIATVKQRLRLSGRRAARG